MLKLKDYNVAYGQSRVINDMNLEIGEGEIVALVGRNGMGKTTLLKSLDRYGASSVRLNHVERARDRSHGKSSESCQWYWLCAPGTDDFLHHDGNGKYYYRTDHHR